MAQWVHLVLLVVLDHVVCAARTVRLACRDAMDNQATQDQWDRQANKVVTDLPDQLDRQATTAVSLSDVLVLRATVVSAVQQVSLVHQAPTLVQAKRVPPAPRDVLVCKAQPVLVASQEPRASLESQARTRSTAHARTAAERTHCRDFI